MNFYVSKNLKVFDLAAVDFSGHPGFLKIEKDIQDIARVATALTRGVAAAKFIHGKENLPSVLQALAEREQRKARPAVAHI